ncbi:hypothetical protein [Enterococcus cecorum]|uniref:hypothetical protein n=1 Tax=Enterococcus cecorum TaxID=44008 RepID=UPI00195B52E2|nr:hypothetical protein [Enterococcus cecorum]MBM6936808.1 hypothetical protein [Enterococcus cecorum]
MISYYDFVKELHFKLKKSQQIFILSLFPHYFGRDIQNNDKYMSKWISRQDQFDSYEYIYLIPLRMLDEFSLPKKEISEPFFMENLVQLKAEFEKYLDFKDNEQKISILINVSDELTKRREFVDYFRRFYEFLNDNFEVEWYILDSGDSGYSILSKKGLPRKITSRKIKIETRKLVNIDQLNNELYVLKNN